MDRVATPRKANCVFFIETKSEDCKNKQIQAEAKLTQTNLRHHSVQGPTFIRCYLQELQTITCFSFEDQRFFLIKRLRITEKKETQKLNSVEISKLFHWCKWSELSVKT